MRASGAEVPSRYEANAGSRGGRSGVGGRAALAALGVAVVVLTPLVLGPSHFLDVLVVSLCFGIAVMGLDLLMGYTGQISVGHAAYMAIGGYSTALLTTRFGAPPLLAMLAGLGVALAVSVIIGLAVLRLRGYFLALATLAFGFILEHLLTGLAGVTGGPSGVANVPPLSLGPFVLDSSAKMFYGVAAIALGLWWMCRRLVGSRFGRSFLAIAADDLAAATASVNVTRYRVLAFALSALLASIAGSLYAHHTRFISPDMVGLDASFAMLAMLTLGGQRTLVGALVGAFLLKLLPEAIGSLRDYQLIMHGLILMLVVVYAPRGLVGLVQEGLQARSRSSLQRVSREPLAPGKG